MCGNIIHLPEVGSPKSNVMGTQDLSDRSETGTHGFHENLKLAFCSCVLSMSVFFKGWTTKALTEPIQYRGFTGEDIQDIEVLRCAQPQNNAHMEGVVRKARLLYYIPSPQLGD